MDSMHDLSIDPQRLYRLDQLSALLGLRRHALKRLKTERGLIIHRAGNRGYVLGQNLIDAICKKQPSTPETNGGAV